MVYYNTKIYGGNEYGIAEHLQLCQTSVFEVLFSGLHFTPYIRDTESMQGHLVQMFNVET